MKRIYVTLEGKEIAFDEPSPEVAAFLKRALVMLEDKKATDADLTALIYGPENPILSRHPLFPSQGYVTKEAFSQPVYPVLADILVRKHAQQERVDVSKIADRFTLTVAQACERLKVTDTAIRKAVATGRLASFRKGGNYYLEPAAVDALSMGKRGPLPSGPLEVVAGTKQNAFLHVRVGPHEAFGSGIELQSDTFKRWRKVGVLVGSTTGLRMFVLEPGAELDVLRLGKYRVEGKFQIAEKINNPAAARKAWKEFRAI